MYVGVKCLALTPLVEHQKANKMNLICTAHDVPSQAQLLVSFVTLQSHAFQHYTKRLWNLASLFVAVSELRTDEVLV